MGVRNVAAWLALAMMLMACPPFTWIVDAVLLAAFVLWYIRSNMAAPSPTAMRLRATAKAVLVFLLFVLPAIELSHRKMPRVVGAPSDHLVVIGDSNSAGIDPSIPAWPRVLERTTAISVKNLALPGATTVDALAMMGKLNPEDTVVLIEIGGNDLLAGTSSTDFSHALEAILSKVTMPGRTVVMFELPLLPHKVEYGRIQRQLAAQYRVWLIPKRFFAQVIRGENATSDGLHLSKVGADRMSALVAQVLSPVPKPESAT